MIKTNKTKKQLKQLNHFNLTHTKTYSLTSRIFAIQYTLHLHMYLHVPNYILML